MLLLHTLYECGSPKHYFLFSSSHTSQRVLIHDTIEGHPRCHLLSTTLRYPPLLLLSRGAIQSLSVTYSAAVGGDGTDAKHEIRPFDLRGIL